MASITVRDLDEEIKTRLRIQSAQHGHSMEEEVRQILRRALFNTPQESGLGTRLATRFAAAGGIEDLGGSRSIPRDPPQFDPAK